MDEMIFLMETIDGHLVRVKESEVQAFKKSQEMQAEMREKNKAVQVPEEFMREMSKRLAALNDGLTFEEALKEAKDALESEGEQPMQDVFNNDEYVTNAANNIETISNIKPKFCTKKEEYAEPPYLDVNELAFKSDDEIKTAQTEYAQKMAEYVKNSGKKKVKYIFNISKRAIILLVVSLILLIGSGVFWGYYIARDGKIIEYNPSVYTSTNDFKYHLEGCSKLNLKTEKRYTLKYVKKLGYKKCDICGSGKYEKYLDEEDIAAAVNKNEQMKNINNQTRGINKQDFEESLKKDGWVPFSQRKYEVKNEKYKN